MLSKKVRPRSKIFRALGLEDPPKEIQINEVSYWRMEILKHDSWAATALYVVNEDKVIVKFNRQQAIFGIPMKWLGNRLASRENEFLKLFAKLTNVPKYSGEVTLDGISLKHASAHVYEEGMPLRRYKNQVDEKYFLKLQQILAVFHEHDVAYLDLNRLENILVNSRGEPFLIDFQVYFRLPKKWPGNSAPMRYLLELLQQGDRYHWMKHFVRFRPDLFTPDALEKAKRLPWFIKIHRCIQVPYRTMRRKLLTFLGYRDSLGQAQSETFVEYGGREANG